jgi:hypothetical protein
MAEVAPTSGPTWCLSHVGVLLLERGDRAAEAGDEAHELEAPDGLRRLPPRRRRCCHLRLILLCSTYFRRNPLDTNGSFMTVYCDTNINLYSIWYTCVLHGREYDSSSLSSTHQAHPCGWSTPRNSSRSRSPPGAHRAARPGSRFRVMACSRAAPLLRTTPSVAAMSFAGSRVPTNAVKPPLGRGPSPARRHVVGGTEQPAANLWPAYMHAIYVSHIASL